jgi:hypothetical protein
MTETNGKPTMITSASQKADDSALSLEEQRRLAGAEPIQLLDTKDLLQSEPQSRGIANAPLPRTMLVLASVGMFALLGLMLTFLFGLGRHKKVAEEVPMPPEPRSNQPSQADQMKTQLALIGQQQDTMPKPSAPEVMPPPKTKPAVTQVPPRPVQPVSQPMRSAAPPIAAPAAPEVDPNELWARLSTTASMSGQVPLAQRTPVSTMPQPAQLIASAQLGAGSLAQGRSPTRGEQGILQQQRVEQVQGTQSHTIPIGSFAKARVTVPMIWGGEDSTLSRSAVELSEPLLDANGEEALPEGTTFVTEVTNIAANGLVEQTAIAALYQRNGEMVQEPLQPGVIVIRGKGNQPLIAEQVERGRGLDLSRTLTSAIAGVSRELGSSVVTSSDQDTAGTIANGALDGFFGTAAGQLNRQTRDRRSGGSTPIWTVEEGEQVSVVVNGFLEVAR